MTSFAQGTNREYANAYNGWFYGDGRRQGAPAPQRGAYGPDSSPSTSPSQQQSRPQPSQQQASPYRAPDMSAYAQPSGGYNAYNVPRTPPQGAQSNDLSGRVPSNQVWGQAYNQAAGQYGVPGATSFTMPGSSTSQSYNPATGQYGQMTGAPSNAGNMAYNAIDSRPAPIQATATGLGGNQMPWQDSMAQREAFAGNLSQRLGQYSGGQLTGPVTFDPSQLMSQANDQLANGTFYNPFGQQNPDVQRAMGNATQYMQGDFQNPFGNSPQANNPQPSWGQQSYDPFGQQSFGMPTPAAPQQQGEPIRLAPVVNVPGRPDYSAPSPSGPIQLAPVVNVPSRPRDVPNVPSAPATSFSGGQRPQATTAADLARLNNGTVPYAAPGAAQPIPPQSQGTPYRPSTPQAPLPPVVDPIQRELDDKKSAAEYRARNNIQLPRAEVTPRELPPHLRPRPNYTNMNPYSDYDPSTGEVFTKLTQAQLADRRMSQEEHFALNDLQSSGRATPALTAAVRGHFRDLRQAMQNPGPPGGRPASAPQPDATQAQLEKIDNEINKWQQATYGTRTGGGPPAEWYSHIQALQRLRTKAAAGDPAALAWNPKMKAPPANVTPTVPVNRRGSAARFGGLMQNGDNRR